MNIQLTEFTELTKDQIYNELNLLNLQKIIRYYSTFKVTYVNSFGEREKFSSPKRSTCKGILVNVVVKHTSDAQGELIVSS